MDTVSVKQQQKRPSHVKKPVDSERASDRRMIREILDQRHDVSVILS